MFDRFWAKLPSILDEGYDYSIPLNNLMTYFQEQSKPDWNKIAEPNHWNQCRVGKSLHRYAFGPVPGFHHCFKFFVHRSLRSKKKLADHTHGYSKQNGIQTYSNHFFQIFLLSQTLLGLTSEFVFLHGNNYQFSLGKWCHFTWRWFTGFKSRNQCFGSRPEPPWSWRFSVLEVVNFIFFKLRLIWTTLTNERFFAMFWSAIFNVFGCGLLSRYFSLRYQMSRTDSEKHWWLGRYFFFFPDTPPRRSGHHSPPGLVNLMHFRHVAGPNHWDSPIEVVTCPISTCELVSKLVRLLRFYDHCFCASKTSI